MFRASQFILDYCTINDYGKQAPTELQKSEISARAHNTLFHYTSFEALKKILSNKCLKFNRIDKVNDRMEAKVLKEAELAHLVFVSCFTVNEIESIPMWSIYGKNKNGIRLSIELKNSNFAENLIDKQGDTTVSPEGIELHRYEKIGRPCTDWSYTINIKDIIYDVDAVKRNPIRTGLGDNERFNLTAMAAIKRREWNYEHECRMIATLRTVRDNVVSPDITYILVPIKFDNIKKLQITFNPWMDASQKEEVKRFITSINELNTKALSFENSILTGEIIDFSCR